MNNKFYIPDPCVDKKLLANLRHARLEMEEIGLQLEEVITKFDEQIRQQKLKRIQK
ncbi:hypothetical protein [Aphanothece hegewaldii]|uniref:hypothetical protein n=1 Tax=Aphanothece hegewaldii TaxID=1521625 RepID=UPI0015E68BC4|nr:hypothetical protein [Aphanothece hegewaldii]